MIHRKFLWLIVIVITSVFHSPTASARQTQDAQVKTWPQAKYPPLASWFRWEGYCEVQFAVDEEGYPFAIHPSCTRRIFCFDAKRAVAASDFHPKLVDGVPTVRTNVVFPLHYHFDDHVTDDETLRQRLEPCEERAVS